MVVVLSSVVFVASTDEVNVTVPATDVAEGVNVYRY